MFPPAPAIDEQEGFLPLDYLHGARSSVLDSALSLNAGILPAQWIHKLIDRRIVRGAPIGPDQIQPASLDLRLGKTAYRIHASFLPGREAHVGHKIEQLATFKLDLTDGQVLQRGQIYLIELEELLHLPQSISAIANPKSSTGRLDIFTRVIADRGEVFDVVPEGYSGRLWAEVSPRTFDVLARRGSRLSQLRFRRRNSQHRKQEVLRLNDRQLEELNNREPLTDAEPLIRNGLNLRVDLGGDENGIVGYKARKHTNLVDLDLIGHYSVDEYWEPVRARNGSIILDPGEFYILASKEEVRIPHDHAAEMAAIDPVMGEFRVHYAGFFDPGFGVTASGSGSRAVLEVRTYDFAFFLEDGQPIGRLAFEKLAEPPVYSYGTGGNSHYQGQKLRLSKHFSQDS